MKDGGPAFPHVAEFIDRVGTTITTRQITEGGMSLRDYFAGQALVGAMTGVANADAATPDERAAAFLKLATILYEVADAMLKAREE
jgi:hypothetical protein